MSNFDKVKDIVKSQLDIDDDSKITMEASFDNDLGADSIAKFELINELEEQFDLTIDDDVAQTLTTIGAVVKFLDENTN